MSQRRATAIAVSEIWDLDPESGVRVRGTSLSPPRTYGMAAEVAALLLEKPGLVPLLDEACDTLRELFGAEAVFELERYDDPESPVCDPMLLLIIRTPLDPHKADALLQRFDDEWWIDNLGGAAGALEFVVRYT